MPFSIKKNVKSINIKKDESEIFVLFKMVLISNSSRVKKALILPQTSAFSLFLNRKRAVSFAFRSNASVSIEAAVCLTLFLLAALSVLSFATAMNQKIRLTAPLRNTCSKLAQDYALYEALNDGNESLIEKYVISGIGIVAAKELFIEETGKDNLDKSSIVNGSSGISFRYSDILDDEGYVDLIITYKIKFPFQIVPFPDINMTQRSRIHAWTGSEVYSEENEGGRYVYVTKTGTVYHTTLSCKHINIKISKVSIGNIVSLRNDNGGKYYPCEICFKNENDSIVYITGSGTAYHMGQECPALTRNIDRVLLSEVIGMPACKSCGGV